MLGTSFLTWLVSVFFGCGSDGSVLGPPNHAFRRGDICVEEGKNVGSASSDLLLG